MANIKVGGVEDFTNFVNAVIDEASFVKLSNAIDAANKSEDAEVIIGGHYDMSAGYFIHRPLSKLLNRITLPCGKNYSVRS